jgi:hypothetical protein
MTELASLNGGSAGVTTAGTNYLEPRAQGLQLNTVGGLAKTTYRDLENQYVDANSGFGADPIGLLTELFIKCQIRSPDGTPQLIPMSETAYKLYKKGLFTNERFVSETTLDGGNLALSFHNAMCVVDPNLPVNSAAEVISAYVLDFKHIFLFMDSRANFTLGAFESLSGYTARKADMTLRIQVGFDHLESSGVLGRAEA